MRKPGSPHYEADLRDLIAKEMAGGNTNETGGTRARRTQAAKRGEKQKDTAGGKARAKKNRTVNARRTQAAGRKLATRLRSLTREK